MEIVNIDARTFENMLSAFKVFADKMESLYMIHKDNDLSLWLDNKEVCQILQTCPRTLQRLRADGRLKYTQIRHKTYYKPEDVADLISSFKDHKKE